MEKAPVLDALLPVPDDEDEVAVPRKDVEFEAVTGPTAVPDGDDDTAVAPVLNGGGDGV